MFSTVVLEHSGGQVFFLSLLVFLLTNRVWLDLDALLDMCHFWLITFALGHHIGVAQSVDEGGTTKTRCTCHFDIEKR